MKILILILASLGSASGHSVDVTAVGSYNVCITSLREDANVAIPAITEDISILYQKKSQSSRDLYLIDSKKLYSCGNLSLTNSSSTEDVLNYDLVLDVNEVSYTLFVQIPSVLTFGYEDFMARESSVSEDPETKLRCDEIESSEFDAAFLETVGTRLNSFPIQFKESAENKKRQEKAKIWGPDWKAKPLIDRERNGYLKVLKNCEKVSALNNLRKTIKNNLISIK